ncbi:MAG: hypothetical protein AAF517_08595 [Planctomycetota bacterium]
MHIPQRRHTLPPSIRDTVHSSGRRPPGWGTLQIILLIAENNPVTTANIDIGGTRFANVEPLTFFYCKPGVHEVEIHATGLPSHRETVSIAGSGTQNVHLIRMTPPRTRLPGAKRLLSR